MCLTYSSLRTGQWKFLRANRNCPNAYITTLVRRGLLSLPSSNMSRNGWWVNQDKYLPFQTFTCLHVHGSHQSLGHSHVMSLSRTPEPLRSKREKHIGDLSAVEVERRNGIERGVILSPEMQPHQLRSGKKDKARAKGIPKH